MIRCDDKMSHACVLLLGQGRVKLADFGLVRSLDESDGAAQQGAPLGTRYFLSFPIIDRPVSCLVKLPTSYAFSFAVQYVSTVEYSRYIYSTFGCVCI